MESESGPHRVFTYPSSSATFSSSSASSISGGNSVEKKPKLSRGGDNEERNDSKTKQSIARLSSAVDGTCRGERQQRKNSGIVSRPASARAKSETHHHEEHRRRSRKTSSVRRTDALFFIACCFLFLYLFLLVFSLSFFLSFSLSFFLLSSFLSFFSFFSFVIILSFFRFWLCFFFGSHFFVLTLTFPSSLKQETKLNGGRRSKTVKLLDKLENEFHRARLVSDRKVRRQLVRDILLHARRASRHGAVSEGGAAETVSAEMEEDATENVTGGLTYPFENHTDVNGNNVAASSPKVGPLQGNDRR